MKTCTACSEAKPLGEFKRDARLADGRGSIYKTCAADKARAYYAVHREEGLAVRARYAAMHSEEKRAADRAYRKRNAEKMSNYGRVWRQTNRDYKRKADAAWRRANPDKVRENSRRRAERERVARHTSKRARDMVGASLKAHAMVLLRDPCSYCGRPAETVDHIDPLALGGAHDDTNLTAACVLCNQRKNATPLLLALLRLRHHAFIERTT